MHKNIAISWTIEFGPIVAFFLALHFLGTTDSGFILSTMIFTALTALALVVSYVRDRRIAWFPLIAGASVVLFGVLTFFFKNPLLFILKDTIYNGFFAIFLLVGLLFGKGLLKPLFGALFDISDRGWFVLSLRWGIFFLALTVLNEIIWRLYGRDAWVVYKFWSTIATIVFGVYQITLSKKHRNEGASTYGMRITREDIDSMPH